MESEFFYSESTKLYVARKPVKIDSRVKLAAEKSGVQLKWDDEGRINFISFDNVKKVLSAMDAAMLSPVEYWKVFKDAKKANDTEMIKSLTSDSFCEWLDRVYLSDGSFIDHPQPIAKYEYQGTKIKSLAPFGTPGWFDPENNIDETQGHPKVIKLFRDKFETSWKYWSPNFNVTVLGALAPIRGYVTSVGKPPYDLGIPVDAQQPAQMLRECRESPLQSVVPKEIIQEALNIIADYQNKKYNEKAIPFLLANGKYFRNTNEIFLVSIRERFIDILGEIKINTLREKSLQKLNILNEASSRLVEIKKDEINDKSFFEFIKTSRLRLAKALQNKKDIVFTMGHKNPDTDTVVSALFEAWRNHLSDFKETTFIPIVQSEIMPDEIKKLLGDKLSGSPILSNEKDYLLAKESGLARWISVDQNREPEVQRYFISIVDHHISSEIAKKQEIPKTIEIIGSCTALITRKMLGMGISLSKNIAQILHGAALMDTENRVSHKMTARDKKIMDYLQSISGIKDESQFYSSLMSALLNTDSPERLFARDYKEDWGFGFAVAKIKNGFSKSGKVLKPELIEKALKLAKENNKKKICL